MDVSRRVQVLFFYANENKGLGVSSSLPVAAACPLPSHFMFVVVFLFYDLFEEENENKKKNRPNLVAKDPVSIFVSYPTFDLEVIHPPNPYPEIEIQEHRVGPYVKINKKKKPILFLRQEIGMGELENRSSPINKLLNTRTLSISFCSFGFFPIFYLHPPFKISKRFPSIPSPKSNSNSSRKG